MPSSRRGRSRGARHRVHVPRHAARIRISGFPLSSPPIADGFGIRPTLLHPDSRGEVLLRSSDPRAPPRIVYNFFSAPNDLPTLREGFKRAREVAYQKPMDPFRGEEVARPAGEDRRRDRRLDQRDGDHCPPSCGTCAMGIGPDAVTIPVLRVRGIEGLRVVDAPPCPIWSRRISTPACS